MNKAFPKEEYQEAINSGQILRRDYDEIAQVYDDFNGKNGNQALLSPAEAQKIQNAFTKLNGLTRQNPNNTKLSSLKSDFSVFVQNISTILNTINRERARTLYNDASDAWTTCNDARSLETKLGHLENAVRHLDELQRLQLPNDNTMTQARKLGTEIGNLKISLEKAQNDFDEINRGLPRATNKPDILSELSRKLGNHFEAVKDTADGSNLRKELKLKITQCLENAISEGDKQKAEQMLHLLSDSIYEIREDEIRTLRSRVKFMGTPGSGNRQVVIVGVAIIGIIILFALVYLGRNFIIPASKDTSTPTITLTPTIEETQVVVTVIVEATPVPSETPVPSYLFGTALATNWTYVEPGGARSRSRTAPGDCVRIVNEATDFQGQLWYFIQFSPNWGNSGWVPQSVITDISKHPCNP